MEQYCTEVTLDTAQVTTQPFHHLVVQNFIPAAKLAAINHEFPPLLTQFKHIDEAELQRRGQVLTSAPLCPVPPSDAKSSLCDAKSSPRSVGC